MARVRRSLPRSRRYWASKQLGLFPPRQLAGDFRRPEMENFFVLRGFQLNTIQEKVVKMKRVSAKRGLIVVIGIISLFMVGCAGMERTPANRGGPFYYPSELVQADKALDEARMAGKDRECPAEFNALKDKVDKAYEVYVACHTNEGLRLAREATLQIKALCPAKPRAEMKSEMKPEAKPEAKPVSKPEPKAVQRVIVLEEVHFDFNKATLTKEAQMILKRHIPLLKENPGMKISIEGHTSAIGTPAYNQKLSERRAASVKAFMIKEGGIAPGRLTTIGYGETALEKPEPNPEIKESAAAKKNRSVIFRIIAE